MGYRSDIFFMMDYRVDTLNNFNIAKKFAAWLRNQEDSIIKYQSQPVESIVGTDLAGRSMRKKSNVGFGFRSTTPWKWYDGYPDIHWINKLMDFMDAEGLEGSYLFIRSAGFWIWDSDDNFNDVEIRGKLYCENLDIVTTIEYKE